MPKNWKTNKLGEVADIQNGYAFKSKDLVESGIPVIKIKNIVPPNISLEGAGYFNGKINEKLEKYIIKRGDFLISMTGSTVNVMSSAVGKMGKYRLDDLALLNQRAGKIYVTEPEKLDFEYLCHFLNRYKIHYNLALNATGSANQANISPAQIKDIDLVLPPLKEQTQIANILSAIDDKIENNLATNKTLEDMAMALYKHWFVDFGPFQDGEFIDSELGEIPEGWEVKRLEELIDKLSKGTTPRMKDKGDLECTIPFLKVKDLKSNGEIDKSKIEYIPESIHLKQLNRSILKKGDLLFSIAGTIGRVSIIPDSLDNCNCNQALAFIRLKDKESLNSLVYNWLKSNKIQLEIESSIVQGVQANISLTILKDLKIIIPDSQIIEKFSKKANPVHKNILDNQKENESLTKLRDTLLPKLISGEVRLKEFVTESEGAEI